MPEEEKVNIDSNVDLSADLSELIDLLKSNEKVQSEKDKELAMQAENVLKEKEAADLKAIEEIEQAELLKKDEIAFREELLKSLQATDQIEQNKELQTLLMEMRDEMLLTNEMYYEVMPAVKQSSELSVFFMCLLPLFMVVKWLGTMFNSAFR